MLALKHCAKKSELLESGGGGGSSDRSNPPALITGLKTNYVVQSFSIRPSLTCTS